MSAKTGARKRALLRELNSSFSMRDMKNRVRDLYYDDSFTKLWMLVEAAIKSSYARGEGDERAKWRMGGRQ